ncbi:hypothetical protein [Thalassotalea marina]|uniref:Uncharacterized protein n=1 Tax=Thalassotalea marina TaxID=1673741 RepID=A0A919BSD6_9GAMM|nr:hypothetical protein [Thalassotalea marina]GHG08189.1 hypothetical protein GCM10017161_42450 [Thalassotalea marina]
MRELTIQECTEVSGNGVALGRAIGRAVQEVGEAMSDWAESLIESWLPIAEKINEVIR